MDKLIEALSRQGAFALALAVVATVTISLYNVRIADFQARLEESRADKVVMAKIIQENTSANQRLADSVDRNTDVVEVLIRTLGVNFSGKR